MRFDIVINNEFMWYLGLFITIIAVGHALAKAECTDKSQSPTPEGEKEQGE